ncbi:MAG: DUF3604 domain-containing protein [Pseudomonadales bacterium]
MKTKKPTRRLAFLFIANSLLLTACGAEKADVSDTTDTAASTEQTQPASGQMAEPALTGTNLYWGDLHVHSRLSFDSYTFGNNNLTGADAFRFARGEPIMGHTGVEAQLKQPLDFLLVSDHAELLGVMVGLQEKHPSLLKTDLGKRWSTFFEQGELRKITDETVSYLRGDTALGDDVPTEYIKDVWKDIVETADQYNEPGKFTAFIGYEWTSMINSRNLHRNVIFRDDSDKALTVQPFSALDSNDPEKLWEFLDQYESQSDGSVMSIPHNGNLSDGLMFAEHTIPGEPLTPDYAERRARWEPIYEMTQVKGDSEAHPMLSPNDEFADFENWDETDIGMNPIKEDEKASTYIHGYARPALKVGLRLRESLGTNPFKFGMIGSTDSHTAFATADDNNYFGKFVDSEPGSDRLNNRMAGTLWHNRTLAASGYAAIWATENTRAGLYDALKRREVYATSGPRIAVRLFGGWNFSDEDAQAGNLAERGYAQGVPMGGDLIAAASTENAAPSFIVSALKDPDGANLDRIQIVKAWQQDGKTAEKIYNVAWSDKRALDKNGKLDALESTVDLKEPSYTNTVGAANLSAHWRDPDFNPEQSAFYYARVIEIATPRWTSYDAARFDQPLPDDVPSETKERAYTSPIWYTPPE